MESLPLPPPPELFHTTPCQSPRGEGSPLVSLKSRITSVGGEKQLPRVTTGTLQDCTWHLAEEGGYCNPRTPYLPPPGSASHDQNAGDMYPAYTFFLASSLECLPLQTYLSLRTRLLPFSKLAWAGYWKPDGWVGDGHKPGYCDSSAQWSHSPHLTVY